MFHREKVGVSIHGCHLDANLNGKKWTEIVWGSNAVTKPSRAGRVVEGIRLARLKKAEMIFLGTGASQRNGVPEAMYTYTFLLDNIKYLAKYLRVSRGGLKKWLEKEGRVVVDTESMNTVEEIERTIRSAINHKLDSLYFVTSDWHAPRVQATVSQVSDRLSCCDIITPELFVHASLGGAYDVRVVERAHRGDQGEAGELQNKLFDLINVFFVSDRKRQREILEKALSSTQETDMRNLR